jgi:Phasin protein
MQHRKQEKPGTEFSLSNPLGEMFAQNANLWFATHAELLANVDALTHAWLNRRREGVNSMREAIQQMTECRDPAEMLRIQQDWLSGALRRASEDVAMLNERIATVTQKATTDFEKAARNVVAPLYAVGEEMRQAAGNKPREGKSVH